MKGDIDNVQTHLPQGGILKDGSHGVFDGIADYGDASGGRVNDAGRFSSYR
ncbi:MAG: hypothetical protein HY318_20000 [Armatimonadetes bacterium]|nr:hypothetical protein [Armatimonadota bacterium]